MSSQRVNHAYYNPPRPPHVSQPRRSQAKFNRPREILVHPADLENVHGMDLELDYIDGMGPAAVAPPRHTRRQEHYGYRNQQPLNAWQDPNGFNPRDGRGARNVSQSRKTSQPKRHSHQSDVSVSPKRSEIGTCTKITLFAVNFLLFFFGLGILALSVYILVLKEKSVRDLMDFVLDPSCDACLIACIITVMTFSGFYGALRENTTMLKMYYYGFVLLLLLEVAGIGVVFAGYFSDDVKEIIFPTETFRGAIIRYRDDVDMENLIDTVQRELQCCGMSDSDQGFLEWGLNPYFNCSPSNASPERCSVPFSCCKSGEGKILNYQCGWNVIREKDGVLSENDVTYISNIHTQGCLRSLGNLIKDNALVIGGVLIGVLLPQVFLIVQGKNLIYMIQRQKCRWS